jgi:hypothetical protein
MTWRSRPGLRRRWRPIGWPADSTLDFGLDAGVQVHGQHRERARPSVHPIHGVEAAEDRLEDSGTRGLNASTKLHDINTIETAPTNSPNDTDPSSPIAPLNAGHEINTEATTASGPTHDKREIDGRGGLGRSRRHSRGVPTALRASRVAALSWSCRSTLSGEAVSDRPRTLTRPSWGSAGRRREGHVAVVAGVVTATLLRDKDVTMWSIRHASNSCCHRRPLAHRHHRAGRSSRQHPRRAGTTRDRPRGRCRHGGPNR